MALTQKQINELVVEYKKHYDGDEEVTEEKVLTRVHERLHRLRRFRRSSL